MIVLILLEIRDCFADFVVEKGKQFIQGKHTIDVKTIRERRMVRMGKVESVRSTAMARKHVKNFGQYNKEATFMTENQSWRKVADIGI